MRRYPQSSVSRGGFTLVELLVVITIIAILFGLIAAATVKMMGKGDELKLRNEVSQLAAAVQAFKTQFAVGYVPDRLVLPPGFDAGTQQYLKSIWPRLNQSAVTATSGNFVVNGTTYTPFSYWGVTGNQPVVLHGDQALVFWLGGTRDAASNCIGFSTDPTDPMKQAGNRISPFFTFPTERLRLFHRPNVSDPTEVAGQPARAFGFPSFVDVYGGMPYVYFSTGKADNNYSNFTSVQNLSPQPIASNPPPYNLAWFSVQPYQTSTSRYANAAGFQIISAGKDLIFGQGSTFWATPGFGPTQQSADDVANFHPTFLGIQAQ